MAWKGCAAVRNQFRAGAKANRSLLSQFVCWLSTVDSRQAAGVRSGVVVTHSAHVLAYRASLSKPLQAGATLYASLPQVLNTGLWPVFNFMGMNFIGGVGKKRNYELRKKFKTHSGKKIKNQTPIQFLAIRILVWPIIPTEYQDTSK